MAISKVLATLSYHDIFDYPLTFAELYKFLISSKRVGIGQLHKQLTDGNIEKEKEYFFLKGRSKIITIRKTRERESLRKIRKAEKFSKILSLIPGILLLGISGSVSMKNADKNDDIDLFIVSAKNQAWMVRLSTILILKLLGAYRGRNDKNVKDKFCVNMVIDEKSLSFKKETQNLYLAHEIAQLYPLFQREKTYEKFIKKNMWIKSHLANYKPFMAREVGRSIFTPLWSVLVFLKGERISRFVQLFYMGKTRGKEIVKKGFLAFHPTDNTSLILDKFKAKLDY